MLSGRIDRHMEPSTVAAAREATAVAIRSKTVEPPGEEMILRIRRSMPAFQNCGLSRDFEDQIAYFWHDVTAEQRAHPPFRTYFVRECWCSGNCRGGEWVPKSREPTT